MKGITWKKKMGGWEGWTKESKEWCSFFVSGGYVQDLRDSRRSKKSRSPDTYKAKDSSEGKKMAEEIFNKENMEKHEVNRQAEIAEGEKFVKLMAETKAFLKKLKLL